MNKEKMAGTFEQEDETIVDDEVREMASKLA